MARPREGDSLNEMLDPHREEEREAAAIELSSRLAQKGIDVGSDEDPSQLADLLSAAEDFERAVEESGGDPMMNMPSSVDPQDPRFVVPKRHDDEQLTRYAARITAAAEALRKPTSD